MKEFLGIYGYTREPEGFMSFEHLLFVSLLMVIMVALAVILGLRNKNKDFSKKNKVLIVSAILINAFEVFKIIVLCYRSCASDSVTSKGDAIIETILRVLPLFLCSIQLITIPLAAFAKGKIKQASLDFVLIFGILGAVLGTYGAGQNYGAYPVLSMDNVVSGITHSISGFASLYIAISGMSSMDKGNMFITYGILIAFCIMAYVVNLLVDYNYMFLMRGDGTPYDIFYNLVNGNKVLYPLIVVSLFIMYITAFYLVYFYFKNKKSINSKKS